MSKMSENKKIDNTLTTILLAGIFAVGKKHKGFIPEAEMSLLKDSLERVKSASILHKGVSLLGTKTPGFAIKILDTFSHGLAYQYAERNRMFREQFSQMHSIYGSDLSIVNLGAGLDFIPDLYAYNNNLETINIDSEEILSQRK
ncbi:MAG: hypothetical protein N4A43_03765 [Alphaproteobacteria bacterium]|jgi:hypothetical protein|nr:hypothetical protein [Alphaproteobacteria bacterium]